MHTDQKSLLARAEFIIGKGQGGDRLLYRRWRRILIDALPRLLGCAQRCPRAEHVCLHEGGEEGRYSAWLRIPIQRRPGRSLVRKLERKLSDRLSAGLLPIHGEVLKVRVRRCRALPEVLPLFSDVNPAARELPWDTSATEQDHATLAPRLQDQVVALNN
jgi:hypothetical protein